MTKEVSYRKGTATEHDSFTGEEGEFTVDTTTYRVVVHDGITVGGIPHALPSDIHIDSVVGRTGDIVLTTDDLSEGSNLFYTDERVDDRLNNLLVGGINITLTYDDVNGTLTVDGPIVPIDSVVGRTGAVTLDTNDISEGSNLYYTDDRTENRAVALLASGTNIVLTHDAVNRTLTIDGPIVPVDSVVGRTGDIVLSTDDVSEGSNLYYTNERVDDRTYLLLHGGTNITGTYDDTNNTLIINGPIVPIDSVNGKTGAIEIEPADFNLDQVPNEDATDMVNWDQNGAQIDDRVRWNGSEWEVYTPAAGLSDLKVNTIGQTSTDVNLDIGNYSVFELEPTGPITLNFMGFDPAVRSRAIVNITNGGAHTVSYTADGGAGTVYYDHDVLPVLNSGSNIHDSLLVTQFLSNNVVIDQPRLRHITIDISIIAETTTVTADSSASNENSVGIAVLVNRNNTGSNLVSSTAVATPLRSSENIINNTN